VGSPVLSLDSNRRIPEGRPSETTLSVLVPVFNEQYLVAASLRRLEVLGNCSLLRRIQVIVVDNGSTDQTPESLRQFRASLNHNWGCGKFEWEFIRLELNQGRGGAILTALELANGELTVTHDADLEYHPTDLISMIPLFLEEDADAVFGSRFRAGEFRRLLYLRHALGNRLVTFVGGLACNLDLSDIETGYKMVRTELLRSIPLESRDFRLEPELVIKLAKRGARIFEVPIRYSGRTRQEGKKVRLTDAALALLVIVKTAISDEVYKKDKFGSHILMRLRRAPRFSRWQAEMLRPYVGQRVLEIGAGIGNLTLNLTPRELYWATDANPLYVYNLQRLTATRPYLHTCVTDVTAAASFPSGLKFDTVICRYVLEHLQDDLLALCNIHRILEDHGRAIILVPQGPKLYTVLDRVLGHCRRYTGEQLIELGRRAGFEVRAVLGFNRVGSPLWWWDGKVLRRTNVGLGRIKLFNALVPLFRYVDPWLPFPPLSLIGVFEKVHGAGPAPVAS